MYKLKKIINKSQDSTINLKSKNENTDGPQQNNIINELNENQKNRNRSISKNFSEKDFEMKFKEFNSSRNSFRRSKNNKFRQSYRSIREKIEFTECTFKPKINTDKPEYSKEREKDIFDRLYGEFDKINKRKNLKRLQRDLWESKIASFSPDLSCSSFRNSQYNKNSRHNSKKFFGRLKDVKFFS